MSFGLGRNEQLVAPISQNEGGNSLKRHIPKGEARIPGYTGHVPARRVDVAGLGKTYGAATRALLSPQSSGGGGGFGQTRSLALDTKPRDPLRVGQYTHPAVGWTDSYKTASNSDYTVAGHAADIKATVSGYSGHVAGTRDRIGGPGLQYVRADKPGGYSVPPSSWRKGRARTEFRDATRLYDKPWMNNASKSAPKASLASGWNPDPTKSAVPLKGGKAVSLGIGPKTERSPWTHTKFPNEYVSSPGDAAAQARADAANIGARYD